MEKMQKMFGGIRMTWGRVIGLSVTCGVVIGLLMLPAFLQGTSFQQPGISYEFWILFALFIVLNCEKPLEAGAKSFAAFVISQPLIYLVQVPFSSLGWQLFHYYPAWVVPTILTFPGGIAAWYVKKGSWLSVLILSVANAILCATIPYFMQDLLLHFPSMLISVLFILAELVFFVLFLFKDRKKRCAAFAVALAMLIVFGIRTVNVFNRSAAISAAPAQEIQAETE